MLNQKRETFRIQIRNQQNLEEFKKKRNFIGISNEQHNNSYQMLLEVLKQPLIINHNNLCQFNQILLNNIQHDLSAVALLGDQFKILSQQLLKFIATDMCFIPEILTVLINITYSCEQVVGILYKNDIIKIIVHLLSVNIEVKTTLELLVNIWGTNQTHSQDEFELILALREQAEKLNKNNNSEQLILICKCLKNLISSFTDIYQPLELNFVLLLLKELIQYGYNNDILLKYSLQCYLYIIERFNIRYIKDDYILIISILKYCIDVEGVGQMVCRLIGFLQYNEQEDYICYLLQPVIEYIKTQLGGKRTQSIEDVIYLCSMLFDCDDMQLQRYYDDIVIIKCLINLLENQIDTKQREAAIQALKILVENSNELQIQQLMELELYSVLIELSKDYKLSQLALCYTLNAISNILKVFSVQTFQIDYPIHLQELALSENLDISREANEILGYFEDIGIC